MFVVVAGAGMAIACGGASVGVPPDAVVTSVKVSGSVSFTGAGQTSQLTATAELSDGTTENVTSSAAWGTSDPQVATVSAAGLVAAVDSGTARITATYGEQSGSLTVMVSIASPNTVRVLVTGVQDGDTLWVQNAPRPQVTQVRVIGVDTPELTRTKNYLIQDQQVWCVTEADGFHMGDEAKMFVDRWLDYPENGPVTVELDMPGGPDDLDESKRLLAYVSYQGQPLTEELLRKGLGNAFVREYGASEDFPDIDSAHALEFQGLEAQAKAEMAGFWGAYTPQYVAGWPGLTTGWPARCAPATVVSVGVSGSASFKAVGQTAQLTATAELSDGTTRNVTSAATWQSSDAGVATVSSTGLVTAVGQGATTITAAYQGQQGSVIATVEPAASVVTSLSVTGSASFSGPGQTSQLTATAQFSDGTTQDVTSSATWQSSDPGVATVSGVGLVTAVGQGATTITAAYQGQQGSVIATVQPAASVVTSVSVTGSASFSGPGQTSQLTATAHFSDATIKDVTTSATWQSSNPGVATVSNTGLVTAIGGGTATITATYQGHSGALAAAVSVSMFLDATLEPPGLDTGIDIVAGQELNVSASGLGQYGYEGDPSCTGYPHTDADGQRYLSGKVCGPKNDCGYYVVLSCHAIGLLIARIGEGPWFAVGSNYSAPAAASGRLRLLYNEAIWYDDSGGYSVTIRLGPEQLEPYGQRGDSPGLEGHVGTLAATVSESPACLASTGTAGLTGLGPPLPAARRRCTRGESQPRRRGAHREDRIVRLPVLWCIQGVDGSQQRQSVSRLK